MIKLLCAFFVLLFSWLRFSLVVVVVKGSSLYPVLSHNDKVLVLRTKSSFLLLRNQIVAINLPNKYSGYTYTASSFATRYIKLITALPGDTVMISSDDVPGLFTEIVIPRGHIYVTGLSENSFDSRSLGPIPIRYVTGVVLGSVRQATVKIQLSFEKETEVNNEHEA